MVRVFIVDDHPLFIDGVKSIFKNGKDEIIIEGYSLSAKEAIRSIKQCQVDVVLIDLIMPELNGLDLFLMLKRQCPKMKTIALTASTDPGLLMNIWRNGVDAILMKYCGKKELVKTIHAVMNNERIIGENTPYFPTESIKNGTSSPKLTRREVQILNILAKNYDRQTVSNILGVSKYAVDFHCKNIFKKFNKNTLISVLEEAQKANIISI